MNALGILFKLLKPPEDYYLPPWFNLQNNVFLRSLEPEISKSSNHNPIIFKDLIERHFSNTTTLFTDGSLQKGGASMLNSTKKQKYKWKLEPHHSILSPELFAIQKASKLSSGHKDPVVIFTDSQANLALISKHQPKTYKQTVYAIQNSLIKAKAKNNLHLVPGHCGIKENDTADLLAKEAAQSSSNIFSH